MIYFTFRLAVTITLENSPFFVYIKYNSRCNTLFKVLFIVILQYVDGSVSATRLQKIVKGT